jgi:hypothetical protein
MHVWRDGNVNIEEIIIQVPEAAPKGGFVPVTDAAKASEE